MDCKFATLSAKVKNDLKKIKNVPLTTDSWTDFITKIFLGLTVHYSENTVIVTINLGAFPLEERHTSDYLEQQLNTLCTDWNILKETVSAVITDNVPNIVKAVCNMFRSSHNFGCFVHSIQLVPQSAIEKTPDLINIINKVKAIVTFCKKSSIAADSLRRHQLAGGGTEGTLLKGKQQKGTRWNTMHYMIERFILMAPWISSVLFSVPNAPAMLLPSEIEIMKEVMEVLKPIEQITRELCSADVTCSKIIPIVKCLKSCLERKKPTSVIGDPLRKKLLPEMDDRFKDIEMKNPILSKATLLDPRFKRIHLPPMVLVQTQREIKTEMNTIETFQRQVEPPNESNDVQDDLWNYHDSRVATQVPERIESHVLPSELRRFLEELVVARSVNPLEYWEAVKSTYRTL